MKKKKIIRISTVPGSLNVFCNGQLRMLSEYFEVLAVSSPGISLSLIQKREGVRTIAVPMERHPSVFKDIVSLIRLIFLFLKEKPDMVHSMTPKAGLLSMLAAYITRVPVRIHSFTGLVFPTSSGLKRKILMLMDSITCACATYINPESKGVAKDLKEYGITKKKLHLIANGNIRGINLEYYDVTDEVSFEARKIENPSIFTFVYVGRLVKDKGINELISAFSLLTTERDDVRLFLIGPREDSLDPLDEKTIYSIENNNQIIEFGEQEDVRPFLAAADAFVFPSYREGMPNVVLEAGAMGLPAIVTDINGSNEIIESGKNGVIIPTHDIASLYETLKDWSENKSKVQKLSKNSRRMIASRYNQKMIWRATLDVYKQLLNDK